MNDSRREFLATLGGGLVGGLAGGLLPFRNVALAALLDESTRPRIDPAAPLAARPPLFRPLAKRVLYLFC